MKLAKSLVVLVTAVGLAGCYWVGPSSQSGGINLTLSAPRSLLPADYQGDLIRVGLYAPGDVSALYGYPAVNPAPIDPYDDILVTVKGSPIQLDGQDYLEVAFPLGVPNAGTITIPDVLPGKKYRLHVQYIVRSVGAGNDMIYYEGLSAAFEVPPGGTIDVSVELYAYNPY